MCGFVTAPTLSWLCVSRRLVQVLDMSWNSIGASSPSSNAAVVGLCDMVIKNTALTHLDISHNNLLHNHCTTLSRAFKRNQTIMCVRVLL